MTITDIRDYCLSKKGATESFPFDDNVLVFKVVKMFALLPLDSFEKGEGSINLKCDPEMAIEHREKYDFVLPGYHMNKSHWNTVKIGSHLSPEQLMSWIDHSYDLIISSLSKKDREGLI